MELEITQLRLQSFDHLIDLSAIPFPPPPPMHDFQWVDTHDTWGGIKAAKPVRLEGWHVTIPGQGTIFVQRRERAMALHDYIVRHLRAATYLAEYQGDLCDWRPGREGKVLRRGYMGMHSSIENGRDLKATLRAIPNQPYQGSVYFTTGDGGCLCPDCVRNELPAVVHAVRYQFEDGWRVTSCEIHWENGPDGEATCDQCSRVVPAVYGAD